jgi:tetratricopeptide (TPR) repeat protein
MAHARRETDFFMPKSSQPWFLFESHSSCPAARFDGARVMVEGSSRLLNRVLVCCLSFFLFCRSGTSYLLVQESTKASPTSSADDLSRRLEAAMEARKSGDLGGISQASERLIALGLVEMAKLRLDEGAFVEAVRLCRASLEFEDTPETRVELAIASLYAKKPADAVEQASVAAERDPRNALAWNIKGEALLQSKDYAGAATALEASLELKQDADSIYALGIAYAGQGKKEKATDTFSHLLAVTGDYGWSRVLVGRAYQEVSMPEEAEAEFGNALRIDPRTPNAHYFWALTLLQANRWNPTSEVRTHLHEELKLNPRHFLANYWLGYFASNERNYDESDHYLRLAADINSSQPEIWMFLGLNAQRRAANRAAETYFRKAITLTKNRDPKEHLAIRRAYFALGRLLVSSGRKKDGEEFLQQAQKLELEIMAESQNNPGAVKAKDGAGMSVAVAPDILETESRNDLPAPPDQGLIGGEDSRVALRAVTKSPQDHAEKTEKHLRTILGSAFNDLATAEALQEKYDSAARHYREAARWDSAIPGLQRNLGLAAFFVGEHPEAIRLLAKVIRATPGDAHARAVLGLAYFATHDFSMAAQTISPIADRAAQDPQLGFAWAKSLAETGNKMGAARALDNLEKANPGMSVENLIQSGQLWLDLSETKRAEQALRQALLADPANTDAKCGLGISLMRLSNPGEAADLFLSVLVDHPDHAEARYQLGRALLEMGKFPEAIRDLEEVTRLQPARLSVHLDLEAAYRKAGRTAEADRERVLCEALKNRRRTAKDHELKESPI